MRILPRLVLAVIILGSVARADDDPPPTSADVLHVMAKIPEERCLYQPDSRGCNRPAGFDHGPDAGRIAAAIAASADGRLLGSRRGDAALMAIFSSYESGNKADAIGDGGKSLGAFQVRYASPEVAFDPARAVLWWRSIAVGSLKACEKNDPDERLASVAGGCSYPSARRKVRQRVKIARELVSPAD